MSFKNRPNFAPLTSTPECPSCEGKIQIAKPHLGMHVTCGHCKMVWEVVWMDPVELDWPYFEGEDDDEYGSYEDDDDNRY